MVPHDEAVFLLHVAAEVEHALMVQYLYAAFSLGGPEVPADRAETVEGWKRIILDIAKEEMGHLITVENLLRLIGGPASFEREEFPFPSGLYPFPFRLEPLTKHSLAKYVLAEMPPQLQGPEVDEIKRCAQTDDSQGMVNRVGCIYQQIEDLFTYGDRDPGAAFVAVDDVDPETLAFQASPDEWGLGYQSILILRASNRREAVDALQAVAEQGEGAQATTLDDLDPNSHCGRFLRLYREFPDGEWNPTHRVPTNPTTLPVEAEDGTWTPITNEQSRCWALLLNLRYRMLLAELQHAFSVKSPDRPGERSPRGLLISWTFGEMYHIRSISEALVQLPLGDPGDSARAAPPFEMPYTLDLPLREVDRWRLHRDLVDAAATVIRSILDRDAAFRGTYLQGMLRSDGEARRTLDQLIAG
jgi:hypothetical protein